MDSMVINRRGLLLAGTCAAVRPAFADLPIPPGNLIAFRLMRRGSEIGRHTVTFERDGGSLAVRVAVDALVTLISVPIVRYTHRVVETWKDEILIGLSGETDKNGQHEWVNAKRGSEGLVVTGSKTQRYIAPEPARATTYWNKHMLDGPMISLEDGVLLRPKVSLSAAEAIPLASGDTVVADHYNLSGAFNIDLWYDRSGGWASMAFNVADGSTVRYERL
jgi:uncharacterized protein DUF6134